MADWVEVMKKRLSIPALKRRSRKSEKSSIGFLDRSSTATSSASATTAVERVRRKTGWLHPSRGRRSMA